jgi:hypothetical protein
VRQELDTHYCENVLLHIKRPLAILQVFDDPGIIFFDLTNRDVVVLMTDYGTPKVLYFKFINKVYDLVKQVLNLPSDFFDRLGGIASHGFIAVRCLHILKSNETRSTVGVGYAATYWAWHLSKSDIAETILNELRDVELQESTPERRATVADTSLAIQWLQVCVLFMFIPFLG